METKLEQIAVKAVNQLPKSVVREIRTPRSVGAGGGQLPPATRWARGNSRPYRESDHRMPNLGFDPRGDTGNAELQSLTAPQFLSICGNRHLVERLGRFALLLTGTHVSDHSPKIDQPTKGRSLGASILGHSRKGYVCAYENCAVA